MKKLADFICKHKVSIVVITILLLIPSLIGMKLTKINYDILVYLPEDIETVKGQNILSDDFNMGAFSITIIENMHAKDILALEDKIKEIDGVEKVISAYDVIGTTIPLEMLPNDIHEKVKNGNADLLMITYKDSTSSETTLDAVEQVKAITGDACKIGGMSAMVLDTMNLSETEITIYIVIAVLLCILVLEVSLDSYFAPILLLINIGIAILFNLGTNLIFGEISYITKALVAVLQLGVTTDFSIFLYHSYENKKGLYKTKEEAMSHAIVETFTSVVGSSLTTIAGFLVLCTMQLTLGTDLGLVMAKGVFLGVVCVLTIFPSLLLVFDHLIEKTKHKSISFRFEHINHFIIKQHKKIFVIFLILLIPAYLANSKVEVYYKLDESLPKTLDSIVANQELAEKFNIVSPEIILLDEEIKTNEVNKMITEIEEVEGIDFVLSFRKLSQLGISESMLSEEVVRIFESDQYQMILINSIYGIATDELNNQISDIQNIIKKYDTNAILAGEGPLMRDLVTISDTDFKNVNTSSIVCILVIMLFVLRSISLPILLIMAIEFAIFINMSIPYFGDITLPFVAPIVLGTIQLGATIDYAILMTTTYLKNRGSGMTKEESMKATMQNCTNSILVSGLCFFAATFGVGVYSKLEMISSLCTLISRGAIISMIVVIFVLPSILLLFDSLIGKTTIQVRKERKTMKKNIKKFATFVLLVSVGLSSIPVSAMTKEETVYVKLNADGSRKSTFVSEHLINPTRLEEMKDISDLQNILNVNGNEAFALVDQNLTWNAGGNDIFYQGFTQKETPVQVEIKYYLNGEEKTLEEILGKSGRVSIVLRYQNRDSHYVNGELLYTPFVVTTATIIDTTNNSNVEVSNGKIVSNGTKNIVVGLSTPGLYESLGLEALKSMDAITISYDTTQFELSSIYSIVTPKIIGSEDLKIFDQMDTLYSSVNLLQSSINQMEAGAKSLVDGASQIHNGTSQIYENMNVVVNKLSELEAGATNVDQGLKQILAKLNETKSILNGNSTESIAQVKYLIEQNSATISKLNTTSTTLKNAYDTYHLKDMTVASIMSFTKDTYANLGKPNLSDEQVLEMNTQLATIKNTYETSYESNPQLITLLEGNNQALQTTLTTLQNIGEQVNTLIATLEGYVTEIEKGASQIVDGTSQIKDGVALLTSKMQELSVGTQSLSDGASQLANGIITFNEQGIQTLSGYAHKAKNLKDKMTSLVKLGETYDTFTMKSSDTKGSTQFVLTVDSVKVKETKAVVKTEKPKKSLWTKMKNLFK